MLLVFHRVFFGITETFIHKQVQVLEDHFEIVLLSETYENDDRFPVKTRLRYLYSKSTGLLDRGLTALMRRLPGVSLSFSAAITRRVDRLLIKHKIKLIHAHYGWSGLRILSLARRHTIPLVVSFHGKDASQALSNASYAGKLRELFDYAAGIIICSPHMAQTLHLDAYRQKVHLIPYGVDVQEFSPWGKAPSSSIDILHVGRLVSKKGVPDLIRAFVSLLSVHSEIRLHIIGEGEEFLFCKRLAAEMKAGDKIIFYGAQGKEEVKRALNDADIFVLNSRVDDNGDMEGLPNGLLEAMSMEKAVLSTIHAGIPTLIKSEYNGLLVPERDNESLATALERLIVNQEMRADLGRKARSTVWVDYSLDVMKSRLERVARTIIGTDDNSLIENDK